MTEQEWLDNLAAQLPERNLEWMTDLARICSTEWTGDKPPTGDTSPPAVEAVPLLYGDASTATGQPTRFQAPAQTDGS
ncbi:hypothetical protein ACH4M4_12280 [Streptomyces sp. NPDC017254]|uniref:hypothetical protein n=1 Tax=unclassified Streptomyces TaxID=2593676 RepID=UPI0037B4C1EF